MHGDASSITDSAHNQHSSTAAGLTICGVMIHVSRWPLSTLRQQQQQQYLAYNTFTNMVGELHQNASNYMKPVALTVQQTP
jgi:hypothetical protein